MKQPPPAPLDDRTDADGLLMLQAAEGIRAAWHALYVRHGAYVYATAYRYLGQEAAARDVAHDVFVALFERAGAYRPSAPFRSFLRRVVVNRCLNERMTARNRRHVPWSEPLVATMGSPEPRPDELLEDAQLRSVVQSAVAALPPRQRIAVVLSRFEGLSYEEIADALDCSISSVESLLFRARQALERMLDEATASFR